MIVLIDATAETLPPEAAVLIDKETPLSDRVTLLPMRLGSSWSLLGALVLWILAVPLVVSAGEAVSTWIRGGEADTSALVLGPVIAPLIVAGATYLTRIGVRAGANPAAAGQGTLARGDFSVRFVPTHSPG
ncbi:MAG: hypothetical protein MJE77_07835 [Proteobacteria bacterium]|nr:hypothetical protein [Pseudomonadota bacterium]